MKTIYVPHKGMLFELLFSLDGSLVDAAVQPGLPTDTTRIRLLETQIPQAVWHKAESQRASTEPDYFQYCELVRNSAVAIKKRS